MLGEEKYYIDTEVRDAIFSFDANTQNKILTNKRVLLYRSELLVYVISKSAFIELLNPRVY